MLHRHPTLRDLPRQEGASTCSRASTGTRVEAVEWLLATRGSARTDALPLYIGDDITDEDAFAALSERGISIVVQGTDRVTTADYALADTDGVRRFLGWLARAGDRAGAMTAWSLVYTGYEPEKERLRETLCALGNGYIVSRACAPDAVADDLHYPGTYLAGGYNRLVSTIDGHEIENEDLVNLPNWLPLVIRIEGGEWIRPTASISSTTARSWT